jgi:hypothetical protein
LYPAPNGQKEVRLAKKVISTKTYTVHYKIGKEIAQERKRTIHKKDTIRTHLQDCKTAEKVKKCLRPAANISFFPLAPIGFQLRQRARFQPGDIAARLL